MYMLERILWGCFSCVSVFFFFTEPGDTSQFLVIPRIPHASTLLWYTHTPRWLTIKLNETNFNANVECILFNGSHRQQVKKGIPLVRAVWHEWMLCFRSSYWHRKNSSNKSIAKLHDFYVNQYYVVTADANIGIYQQQQFLCSCKGAIHTATRREMFCIELRRHWTRILLTFGEKQVCSTFLSQFVSFTVFEWNNIFDGFVLCCMSSSSSSEQTYFFQVSDIYFPRGKPKKEMVVLLRIISYDFAFRKLRLLHFIIYNFFVCVFRTHNLISPSNIWISEVIVVRIASSIIIL